MRRAQRRRRSALHLSARRALRPARRLPQLRLRRPGLRLADHHQPVAARGRRLDQHGLLPEPGRHDLPAAARRRRGQRARRRLLQPHGRLAGRPRADHRHSAAPAPGELAGLGARAVHRGGAGAGHDAGRPRRPGAGGGRRRRRRPLHPRAGLAARVPAELSGAVSSPTLRAVAWPEPNRAYAVGDLGAMWLWRAETGLWEKDPAAPPAGFQGDLDGIAFDPQNPALGYAVGQSGALLRYDKTWTQEEELPQGFQGSELHLGGVRRLGGDGRRRQRPAGQQRLGLAGRPRSPRAARELAERGGRRS